MCFFPFEMFDIDLNLRPIHNDTLSAGMAPSYPNPALPPPHFQPSLLGDGEYQSATLSARPSTPQNISAPPPCMSRPLIDRLRGSNVHRSPSVSLLSIHCTPGCAPLMDGLLTQLPSHPLIWLRRSERLTWPD